MSSTFKYKIQRVAKFQLFSRNVMSKKSKHSTEMHTNGVFRIRAANGIINVFDFP